MVIIGVTVEHTERKEKKGKEQKIDTHVVAVCWDDRSSKSETYRKVVDRVVRNLRSRVENFDSKKFFLKRGMTVYNWRPLVSFFIFFLYSAGLLLLLFVNDLIFFFYLYSQFFLDRKFSKIRIAILGRGDQSSSTKKKTTFSQLSKIIRLITHTSFEIGASTWNYSARIEIRASCNRFFKCSSDDIFTLWSLLVYNGLLLINPLPL